MPRLWDHTIATHRQAVEEAILETAWRLVAERGLPAVTMSEIAREAGIGRATLYKYFPDVEAILVAWHQRHIAGHVEQLTELSQRPGDPGRRLTAVLEAYALIMHRRGREDAELGALLHRREQIAHTQQRLLDLIRDLLTEVADQGQLRRDVSAGELAAYCLHALTAAGTLQSEAAVRRLVGVTLAGLRAN